MEKKAILGVKRRNGKGLGLYDILQRNLRSNIMDDARMPRPSIWKIATGNPTLDSCDWL